MLLLDSVGTPMAFDPTLMPFVSSLMASSLFGEARACPAKATFPCVKSIFEGRTATTGTTLQDFSAVASKRTTWPSSLAKLGKRLVVASDHTLNRLYPEAFVDSLNYETLRVPLFERDGYAYRQTERWLADPSIDVLLVHIIGTDKISHEYKVGGPEYRSKYREVDDFVRDVAGRLTPQDYLYVIGDHGHNETGGHTEDAAYIAHGPLFPQGKHENLNAADMLFLLSAPYALSLPDEYEGNLRTDLTLMPDQLRQRLLREQARLWRLPYEAFASDTLEARLNEHVIQNRGGAQREHALEIIRRVGPWVLAAALFLLSQFGLRNGVPVTRRPSDFLAAAFFGAGIVLGLFGVALGAWLVSLAALWWCFRKLGIKRTLGALTLLALLGTLAFWLLPTGAPWFHVRRNQPIGWAVFYPLAVAAGLVLSRASGSGTARRRLTQVLWTIGVALWLLAYFGPYNYALTGRGPKVILLILAPLAIFLAGGWRTLLSWPALCLFGLLPFVTFHTESYNIQFRVLDRISAMPIGVGLSICAALGLVWLYAMQFRRSSRFGWTIGTALLVAWLVLCSALFQFEAGKIIGCLMGALWLAGCLELFRRARLSLNWSALVGMIMLFTVFHFVMNGFALSHVDFRFASDKIIQFQEEAWRAPQLIIWVCLKYFAILLPVLAVIFVTNAGSELSSRLLQFGWWRELMLILSTLGLSLFEKSGLDELCSEEIYFWTFLNVVVALLALAMALAHRRILRAPAEATAPEMAGRVA